MSANRLNIVVEGDSDAKLIRKLLGTELSGEISFYSARRKSSQPSLARNLLVHERGAVLVVMDSDTLEPQLINEQQALTKLALNNIAPGGDFDVLVIVPQLEVLFFETPEALELLLQITIPQNVIDEGMLIPQQTLDKLFGQSHSALTRENFIDAVNIEIAAILSTGVQAGNIRLAVNSLLAKSHLVDANAH